MSSSSRATASLTGVGGVTGLAVEVDEAELGVDGEEADGEEGGVTSLDGTGGAFSFPLTACEIPNTLVSIRLSCSLKRDA